MKKYVVLFFLLILSSQLFAYHISKDYDNILWKYRIVATNESIYNTDDSGNKSYEHTVIVKDASNKINYVISCETETDVLKTYHDYVTKYKISSEITELLIPELEKLVVGYSPSDDGSWMFCYLSEYVSTDYSEISDEDFRKLFIEKYDSGIISKEELLISSLSLFDDCTDIFQYIIDIFIDENHLYKEMILSLLECFETDENEEVIDRIEADFRELLQIDVETIDEYKKTYDE